MMVRRLSNVVSFVKEQKWLAEKTTRTRTEEEEEEMWSLNRTAIFYNIKDMIHIYLLLFSQNLDNNTHGVSVVGNNNIANKPNYENTTNKKSRGKKRTNKNKQTN